MQIASCQRNAALGGCRRLRPPSSTFTWSPMSVGRTGPGRHRPGQTASSSGVRLRPFRGDVELLLVRLGASCSLVDGPHRTNVHFVVSHRPIPRSPWRQDRYPFLGRRNPRRSGRASRIGGMTAERAGRRPADRRLRGVLRRGGDRRARRVHGMGADAWQVQPLYGVGPGISRGRRRSSRCRGRRRKWGFAGRLVLGVGRRSSFVGVVPLPPGARVCPTSRSGRSPAGRSQHM
jgi:hypothetical protein